MIFGECFVKAKICHGTKPKNTASSALLQKKGFLVYEAWIFLQSMDFFFPKHEKKGRWFSPKAQKGMYKKFHASQRSKLQIVYILDSKLYTSNITVLVQQMLHSSSKNAFTITTSLPSGPSTQLHLAIC
jgi:hypothetical protein